MDLIHPWIVNNGYIIPAFSEKSRHCLNKVQSQMHFYKNKQTNSPFGDQSHHKIIIKRRDFYSATLFKNLKRAFNSVEAIISKYFLPIAIIVKQGFAVIGL